MQFKACHITGVPELVLQMLMWSRASLGKYNFIMNMYNIYRHTSFDSKVLQHHRLHQED